MGDEERDLRDTQGGSRVQHVVLHGPADSRTMAAALRPAIERSRSAKGNAAPACLVITPTVEQALAVADSARTLLDDDTNRVVPVSAVVRAKRVLEAGPVAVVSGTPHDLLALRKNSGINLESLRAVVLVGLDELLADSAQETLQALLADAPVEAMRIATLDAESAATDAFIEAYLRRARRVNPAFVTEASFAITPRYVVSTPAARADLLRAVLDEIDPPSIAIVATSEAGETDARRALARLGVSLNSDSVTVARHAPKIAASLVVLWEAAAGAEALTEAVAGHPANAIAFLLPDEVPSFHRLTGGAAEPWTPTVRKDSIESRTRTLRTALRSTLANGGASASELALLAPLLDSHDAIEIAAAALRLYEGARREATTLRTKTPAVGTPMRSSAQADGNSSPAAGNAGARARVFLAVGKRDGVKVGDIVGAVANEAGLDGERIGSVELYESHTTVELDAADAARVIATMGETELKGRRLGARIDERPVSSGAYGAPRERSSGGERSPRSGGFGRDRGERPSRGGSDRSERGPRSARSFGPPRDRGDREDRGERPSRPSFGDRGERPARPSFSGDRSERPSRPSFGGDRSERPSRPSFGGDRSERPSRPSFGGDRSERPSRPSFSDRGDRPARPSFGGDRSERPSRPSFGGDRSERPSRSSSSDRGERSARPERSGPPRERSSFGGGRGDPRASDVRRSFNDRPISERTESKSEWSSRGDSMKNAKRAPRKSSGTFDEV
ncbi:MAG: DbpA RNA binding domain-containing protein [Gemmatimonadaceae bacterium]